MATSGKRKPFDVKNFAVSALRRASYRTPMYTQVKQRARVAYGRYKCAHCQGTFGPKDIQVDHVDSVVPVTGWDGFDGFVARLFCPAECLQVLCRECHTRKSSLENAVRRETRMSL